MSDSDRDDEPTCDLCDRPGSDHQHVKGPEDIAEEMKSHPDAHRLVEWIDSYVSDDLVSWTRSYSEVFFDVQAAIRAYFEAVEQ